MMPFSDTVHLRSFLFFPHSFSGESVQVMNTFSGDGTPLQEHEDHVYAGFSAFKVWKQSGYKFLTVQKKNKSNSSCFIVNRSRVLYPFLIQLFCLKVSSKDKLVFFVHHWKDQRDGWFNEITEGRNVEKISTVSAATIDHNTTFEMFQDSFADFGDWVVWKLFTCVLCDCEYKRFQTNTTQTHKTNPACPTKSQTFLPLCLVNHKLAAHNQFRLIFSLPQIDFTSQLQLVNWGGGTLTFSSKPLYPQRKVYFTKTPASKFFYQPSSHFTSKHCNSMKHYQKSSLNKWHLFCSTKNAKKKNKCEKASVCHLQLQLWNSNNIPISLSIPPLKFSLDISWKKTDCWSTQLYLLHKRFSTNCFQQIEKPEWASWTETSGYLLPKYLCVQIIGNLMAK